MEKNIILPNYEHSVLNTITSILKYYKVETNHSSLNSLDIKLNKEYKNVVLIILDGMGEHILENISHNGYFSRRKIDCVTSVYPSGTTAALTTYYAGNPPYETGWIGWSQYFKEYGRTLDMFSHKESYKGETIEDAKIDVFDTVVKYIPIFERIEEASPDVQAYEITPTYSDKRSKRTIRADNLEEIVLNLEILCNLPQKKFIMAYCDNPDSLLHTYGTSSEEAKEFIINAEERIEKMCKKFDEDTIVIISADHGHKDIEKVHTLLDYPEIQECLIMPPSLESRVVAFWVKENMKKEFEKRFNKIFGEEFLLLTTQEFLDKNFLGFGEKHPKIDDFIGNYIALSTSNSIIRLETFLAEGKKVKKSTHCGLSKEEMEVPVIVIEPKMLTKSKNIV